MTLSGDKVKKNCDAGVFVLPSLLRSFQFIEHHISHRAHVEDTRPSKPKKKKKPRNNRNIAISRGAILGDPEERRKSTDLILNLDDALNTTIHRTDGFLGSVLSAEAIGLLSSPLLPPSVRLRQKVPRRKEKFLLDAKGQKTGNGKINGSKNYLSHGNEASAQTPNTAGKLINRAHFFFYKQVDRFLVVFLDFAIRTVFSVAYKKAAELQSHLNAFVHFWRCRKHEYMGFEPCIPFSDVYPSVESWCSSGSDDRQIFLRHSAVWPLREMRCFLFFSFLPLVDEVLSFCVKVVGWGDLTFYHILHPWRGKRNRIEIMAGGEMLATY